MRCRSEKDGFGFLEIMFIVCILCKLQKVIEETHPQKNMQKYPNTSKQCNQKIISIPSRLPVSSRCKRNILHYNLEDKHKREDNAEANHPLSRRVVLLPLKFQKLHIVINPFEKLTVIDSKRLFIRTTTAMILLKMIF